MSRLTLIIASGPSANRRDAEILASTGARVVCVNNAWSLYPTCDTVYAGDAWWWNRYGNDVPATAYRVWSGRGQNLHGCEYDGPFTGTWNSGQKALEYVLRGGADRVMLLGFDCRKLNGKVHFHPDHDGPNPRDENLAMWAEGYGHIKELWPHARVLNVSPDSAIPDFQKVSVWEALDIFKLKAGNLNNRRELEFI